MDISKLNELSHAWEEVRENYDTLSNDEYDAGVLECSTRLAANPSGELAYAWTIGLVLMAPYLAYAIDDTGKPEALAALRATDGALRDRTCPHDEHPYAEHEEEFDLDLAEQLRGLVDPTADWDEDHSRETWRCPRNVAGFARIATDIIEPGSAQDVPPRLPVDTENTIKTLSAVLHGYPDPGTDLAWALTSPALDLRGATTEDRPGHLLTVRAVGFHAGSDMWEDISVLDELIDALEQALPHYADATCDHVQHPELPQPAPDLAELGITLATAGGRARYERNRYEDGAPLEALLCPAVLADLATDTLDRLRARRAWLDSHRTPSTTQVDG
ncbi:hypothetical protein ABT168_02010 [Streptomyces sp. NPDC001793]|uniref:hypothetical protein n=1 Tax=Streptomyces sp. NPDC001793 TaxID=3154657 RepID=UPI00332CAF6D